MLITDKPQSYWVIETKDGRRVGQYGSKTAAELDIIKEGIQGTAVEIFNGYQLLNG